MPDSLLDRCRHWLGPVDVVADRSWPHGVNLVLQVRDRRGRSWIAKAVHRDTSYHREIHAYQHWVPALGRYAPQLAHRDDSATCFVVEVLPGRILDNPGPDVHRQAGALIARLHSAETGPGQQMRDRLGERVRSWVDRSPVRPDDHELIDFVTGVIDALEPVAVPTVSTHGDNQPRNWLVDDDGVVRLIDFGLAELHWWARDLTRMRAREWLRRPDLRDAFLAGYGREITPAEETMLRAAEAQNALTTIFWAREHHDPAFEAEAHATLTRLRN